jgi:methylmalonyl-CoA mutase
MTDNAARHDLAAGFEPASYDTWRGLVEKALKGADFEKRLVSRTADGLSIKPLYTRADALPAAQDAVPGAAPFTRGAAIPGEGHGWQIHQRVAAADPGEANALILEELEGGAGGIVLQTAAPGQHGLKLASKADIAGALAAMHLDFAPVQLEGGFDGLKAAACFLQALADLKPRSGDAISRLNVDPLGALARFGTAGRAIDAALAEAAALATDAARAPIPLTSILVDARIPHEAGASEAQELAYLASALVTYLRGLEATGIAPAEAFKTIAFALAVDTDLFLTAAKLRAARTLIARIAQSCGAAPASMHITAFTSARMMAKRDPWTNMLRTTAACAGAVFGGADAVTVLPYTFALGAPDRFARRIARNTQLVLQEESSLGRVVDPVGGSWYVESLTNELAQVAWELFQATEKQGGLIPALKSGTMQAEIARTAEARMKSVATGRQELTGVSVFPMLGNDGVKIAPVPEAAPAPSGDEVKPLVPHRLAEPFEELRDASDAFLARTGQRPRIFLASLGPIIEHNRRSTWVWNFLAAGGIEGLTTDGYKDAAEAAAAFKRSGAGIACLCSSDAIYAEQAVAAATALKAAGARRVLLAGKPGDAEAALKEAGVDGFLFAGQNALATLKELQTALGVA